MSSPTPIAIRTPSSLPDNELDETVVCKFCRRQFAKYTCPTCNVPYCSLTCFRSEAHSQCSETFYKKEIVIGIHTEPSKTTKERLQTLELLKRFEEENAETSERGVVEDDDDNGLSQRFSSIDLDTASVDTIWSILTPEERERFMKTVQNPSSDAAQQLLSSEELSQTLREPWWEPQTHDVPDDPPERDQDTPSMMAIPDAMFVPIPNRPLLVYNLSSICTVYAFVVRHLGVASFSSEHCAESDLEEAYNQFARLLPCLFERKSTTVYGGLSSVLADLLSRFDRNTNSPSLLSTLLRDSSHLMTPLGVVESTNQPALNSHAHQRPLLVLSDIAQLLSRGLERGWVPQRSKHIPHKLVFYGAHVATMPTPLLRRVAEELKQRGEAFREEAKTAKAEAELRIETKLQATRPLVQEL